MIKIGLQIHFFELFQLLQAKLYKDLILNEYDEQYSKKLS